MTGTGSLTQTIATAALAGTVALGGTTLQVQGPVDAFKLQYTQDFESRTSDILAALTDSGYVPAVVMRSFSGLEQVKSDARWRKYVYDRLQDLRNGEDDFSEFPQPAPGVIDRAWNVANRVLRPDTPTPSVVPSDEGSVVFVWHKARWDLEIEVSSGEVKVWAHSRSTGEMFSGSLEEHSARLSHLLDFLAWH